MADTQLSAVVTPSTVISKEHNGTANCNASFEFGLPSLPSPRKSRFEKEKQMEDAVAIEAMKARVGDLRKAKAERSKMLDAVDEFINQAAEDDPVYVELMRLELEEYNLRLDIRELGQKNEVQEAQILDGYRQTALGMIFLLQPENTLGFPSFIFLGILLPASDQVPIIRNQKRVEQLLEQDLPTDEKKDLHKREAELEELTARAAASLFVLNRLHLRLTDITGGEEASATLLHGIDRQDRETIGPLVSDFTSIRRTLPSKLLLPNNPEPDFGDKI
ncbi:hypothetical protein BV898_01749 [Hypsibius exemplaris]|uniref:Uncharacterized protein n=1 Tax=Hypsibius exemplaris TaxID=2072580 RepID=A0A1W0XB80_HYPEX|nr:hypothetical protein BV898_01749 [Hypsibius exemplaris]